MERLKTREGDFLETAEGLIFDVKGLVHPPDRVVAYLRYIVDSSGDRKRGERTYVKVYSISERERILRSRYPRYLFHDPVFGEHLEGVPNDLISKLYEPTQKVSELLNKPDLDQFEAQAIQFTQIVHDSSSVQFGKLGLSGSVLVDLHTAKSDIDLIVYGRDNCISVHDALRQLIQRSSSVVSAYSLNDLKRLYEFRSKDTRMGFEDFLEMERRKFLQGRFKDRDFFIRLILDWDEVDDKYGDRLYRPVGYAKIEAKVEDDADSIFTPCRYGISEVTALEGANVPFLKEIVSFRGRFCEQARKGETVITQGKVEKVIEKNGTQYFRLILGAKPSDFMIVK